MSAELNIKLTDEQIEHVIIYLQGSCFELKDGIQSVLERDDVTESNIAVESLIEIDNRIFVCSTCNWWYELSEQSKDGENCQDCNEDDDEDTFS